MIKSDLDSSLTIIKGNNQTGETFCQINNSFGKGLCYITTITSFVVESNLLEIYFTGRVLMEVQNSTKNVTALLTKKAITDRKR